AGGAVLGAAPNRLGLYVAGAPPERLLARVFQVIQRFRKRGLGPAHLVALQRLDQEIVERGDQLGGQVGQASRANNLGRVGNDQVRFVGQRRSQLAHRFRGGGIVSQRAQPGQLVIERTGTSHVTSSYERRALCPPDGDRIRRA